MNEVWDVIVFLIASIFKKLGDGWDYITDYPWQSLFFMLCLAAATYLGWIVVMATKSDHPSRGCYIERVMVGDKGNEHHVVRLKKDIDWAADDAIGDFENPQQALDFAKSIGCPIMQ